jgi:hypothetical protein
VARSMLMICTHCVRAAARGSPPPELLPLLPPELLPVPELLPLPPPELPLELPLAPELLPLLPPELPPELPPLPLPELLPLPPPPELLPLETPPLLDPLAAPELLPPEPLLLPEGIVAESPVPPPSPTLKSGGGEAGVLHATPTATSRGHPEVATRFKTREPMEVPPSACVPACHAHGARSQREAWSRRRMPPSLQDSQRQ